ncbi:DUF3102 domain-containing protein [Caldifermentibacillus hisashii]|uniref:DUF3102 domain-containing protein n=1 Tax=Caldifermentibacillus hisashii TaxID=996558 RepID=UPI002E0A3E31|nr:DUF3102 domain-containing protein [Caldifermentibacillus hisashii]
MKRGGAAEINAYQRIAGEAIFEIGRRLKHVKENDLAHGQWSKWCKESIGMDRAQADKFIRIVDEFGDECTYTQMGLRALYEIATMPPEQRNKPHTIPSTGEVKTVDEMTVRELREVKKALKEAQQEKELAENGHRCPIWESLHYTKLQRYPNPNAKNRTEFRQQAKIKEFIKFGLLLGI